MLYKYSITPEQEGLENVDLKTGKMFMLDAKNNAFTDEVSKWSMNVYSTFDLSMADNGVVEDGVGRLEEFNVPLDSNAKVVDSESDYLVFPSISGRIIYRVLIMGVSASLIFRRLSMSSRSKVMVSDYTVLKIQMVL